MDKDEQPLIFRKKELVAHKVKRQSGLKNSFTTESIKTVKNPSRTTSYSTENIKNSYSTETIKSKKSKPVKLMATNAAKENRHLNLQRFDTPRPTKNEFLSSKSTSRPVSLPPTPTTRKKAPSLFTKVLSIFNKKPVIDKVFKPEYLELRDFSPILFRDSSLELIVGGRGIVESSNSDGKSTVVNEEGWQSWQEFQYYLEQ